MNERKRIMKNQYYTPQTEVVIMAATGTIMTTSISLPPDMGAPKRRTPVF